MLQLSNFEKVRYKLFNALLEPRGGRLETYDWFAFEDVVNEWAPSNIGIVRGKGVVESRIRRAHRP